MQNAEDARVALLSGLIDHAPLFPPASMPLGYALEEDRRARESPSAFVLGRFVCPVSLLPELRDVRRGLSVVVGGPLGPGERTDAVEAVEGVAPPSGGELEALARSAAEVYVEVPLDEELDHRLDALAGLGARAKVRCGGASVPSADELARFVRGCVARGLVFKATAGLHHALPTDGEHGFLNLLAASVFGDEKAALEEKDPSAFRLDHASFGWRGRSAGADELRTARRERLASIGSCSFFEPVSELEALGVLPL